jgi:hypothetical protein
MVDIVFVDIFLVDHQGERYVLCLVFPQSRSLFAFVVSVRCKSFAQQIVNRIPAWGSPDTVLQAVLWYLGHVYKGTVQRSVRARYIDTNVCAKW